MREFGYGVNYTKITWKKDVKDILVKTAVEKTEYIRKMYEEFCSDTDNTEKAAEDFTRQYENDMFLWGGTEGLLCDIINETEFCGRPIFKVEDCCIYVPAYIPVDEKDKALRPTREQIDSILSGYLKDLTVSRPEAEWLTIQL
jgi:hypothetical protein